MYSRYVNFFCFLHFFWEGGFAGRKRYKIWVMVSVKSVHLKPWKCCFLTNTNLQHEIDYVNLAD